MNRTVIISVLGLFTLMLGVTGCGDNSGNSGTSSNQKTSAKTVSSAPSTTTKSKVFMGTGDDIFTVSNSGTAVYGGPGNDAVTIADGVTNVTVDQNVEQINFSGTSSSYTFKQTGNMINVYDSNGASLIVTAPVQGDSDGTILSFSNETASAMMGNGGVMTLGGSVVSSTTPGTFQTATTYSTADLNGTWSMSELRAADAPYLYGWSYSERFFSNGSGTTTLYANSWSSVTSGSNMTYSVSSDGLMSINGESPASTVVAKSKNIAVITYTANSGAGAGLAIMMKKSGTFSTSDLAGTWNLHLLETGDGSSANIWGYAAATITSTGFYTNISGLKSDGSIPSGSLTLSLTSDGVITSISNNTLHGYMSSDKNLFVLTLNNYGGTGNPLIMIGVKSGAAFTQSDLGGTWAFYGLQSTDAANKWFRGNLTVNATTGTNSFSSMLDSTGLTSFPNTTGSVLSISSSGIITDSANSTTHGVMSPNKELIVVTKTSGGTTNKNFFIGTKR